MMPSRSVAGGYPNGNSSGVAHHVHHFEGRRSRTKWESCLDDLTLSCPRTKECFHDIEQDDRLSFRLAPKSSTLGQVLQHCRKVIDSFRERLQPCTFKIGFSHDPGFRFYNHTFGYVKDRDGWQGMMVIFCSHDPVVASYVEAAMIQLYIGHSPPIVKRFFGNIMHYSVLPTKKYIKYIIMEFLFAPFPWPSHSTSDLSHASTEVRLAARMNVLAERRSRVEMDHSSCILFTVVSRNLRKAKGRFLKPLDILHPVR